jgi:hypothetical protein
MLKFTLAMGVAALALEMQRVLAIASRFDTNCGTDKRPRAVPHSHRRFHQ